jgi:hypothetical protein
MAKKTIDEVINDLADRRFFCKQLIERTRSFKAFWEKYKPANYFFHHDFNYRMAIIDVFIETEEGQNIWKKLCPDKSPRKKNIVRAEMKDHFLYIQVDLGASKNEIMRQIEWYVDKYRAKIEKPATPQRGGKIRSIEEIMQIFGAFDTVEQYGPEQAMRILYPETVDKPTAIDGEINPKYRQLYDWHREIKAKLKNL